MKHDPEPIHTDRLILRQWQNSDRPAWAALNADPEVRRFWPTLLTREQSDGQLDTFRQHIEDHGFGLWCLELKGVEPCAGFVGLDHYKLPPDLIPTIEIGWRLARKHWGKGYATEAARAVLADAFGRLGLEEVIAYAVVGNDASFRIMDRLGMTRDLDGDFDIPGREPPLRRATLYRIRSKSVST